MKKPYQLALHIFRRDLRLQDNTALLAALSSAKEVIPCFIFDTRQIKNNEYKSEACIQFMMNSLHELNTDLKKNSGKLFCFNGIAEKIVEKLLAHYPINAVFVNRDYTPFSRERDLQIAQICKNHHVDFHSYADALLHEPEEVLKPNNKPYTIFTPFFKKASLLKVESPQKNIYKNYFKKSIISAHSDIQKYKNKLIVKGGRKEGLQLLKNIKKLSAYKKLRDIPSAQGTSHLSAHNKFGTISIREFYAAIINHFSKSHGLITELHWRDFFTHIAYHFPRVFGHPFQDKYKNLTWSNNKKHFLAWCEGRTGFPIVDAGMRQLNTTGYMHNRVRMIVASFLVKDLHIDWRWGEKYFAQQLVDYDPAVNNGNWQWAASTGCDAQPYFRIFNPWLQQKKYDPQCIYIKKYVTELAKLAPQLIHGIEKTPAPAETHYPAPIVDHSTATAYAKKAYKNA